ncbi:MAG: hypothetical protein IID53_16915 [Proteobacteria bacterium]|nr:hypothetical protein [Pseudomonadota bacterium]
MIWADPISFREHVDDDAPRIVELMAARDVDLNVDSVRLMISIARQAHRRALSAWLRQNEPEYMVAPSTGPYAKWENRGKGSTGRFRDGSDVPRAPLASIYFLVNEFWRRELGLSFHPDFRPLCWDEDFTLQEQLAMLKGPALFFVLIAQSVDFFNYTARRCSLIHDGNYGSSAESVGRGARLSATGDQVEV